MKQLRVLLPTYPLDRMSVHPTPVTSQLSSPPPPPPSQDFIRLPWLISATHLYSWMEWGAVRNKCCTRTKHITWPGYKCRPHDPESTSLIIRPPYLHKREEFMLNPCKKQILKNRRKIKILLSDF